MQKLKLAGLSILSGLLMGLSWPETGGLSPLFFVAFIPLLYVEHIISQNPDKYKSRHVFFNAYLAFIVFNSFTTWWIWFASEGGMIMAEVLYSLFMAIVFLWFHGVKKRLGNNKGYFALIILWVGFEWVHYNWEFSHPWNSLGNVFANSPTLIQWYEYTGVLGGTLWILIINVLLFHLFKKIILTGENIKNQLKLIIGVTLILVVPSIFSTIMYYNYVEEENPIEIVVVQPNIDPYKDKFGGMTEAEQIDKIIALAKEKITPNTKYVVAPETAIPRGFEEGIIEQVYGIQAIRKLIAEYPNIQFIIGATTYLDYPKSDKKPTPTARIDKRTGDWYDAYNSALKIDASNKIQIYHKSKLVLGTEKLPYPKLFAPLEKFAIGLGGSMVSYGTEKEAFNLIDNEVEIAPVICYESIYGDYVASYVKKGANTIFIITNDGWWDNSPGYRQHLAYARLRAIETRRSIARSANTGTSCFINQRGDVIQPTKWWENAVIRNTININNVKTYYTINGDLLGRVSAFISLLLLLWSRSIRIKQRIGS
jgi:apolipoprotein N-acyltransferase